MCSEGLRMSEQANISKLQDLYQAFGRGEIDAIAAACTEDVSWGTDTSVQNEVPWYRIRSGRDGVVDFFSTLATEANCERLAPTLWPAAATLVRVRAAHP